MLVHRAILEQHPYRVSLKSRFARYEFKPGISRVPGVAFGLGGGNDRNSCHPFSIPSPARTSSSDHRTGAFLFRGSNGAAMALGSFPVHGPVDVLKSLLGAS